MTDVWSDRAEAYRQSPAHREGPDLDAIVEWSAGLATALDVATGGGHVARRLREAGLDVTTVDPAAGMEPDVVAPAERMPFEDASFDLVVSRLAAHHFSDVRAAMRELARIARRAVIVVDNTFGGDALEEAEQHPRFVARPLSHRPRNGARCSRRSGSASTTCVSCRSASSWSPGSSGRDARARPPRASVSSSPTAPRTAG